jgi:hypothetical protein
VNYYIIIWLGSASDVLCPHPEFIYLVSERLLFKALWAYFQLLYFSYFFLYTFYCNKNTISIVSFNLSEKYYSPVNITNDRLGANDIRREGRFNWTSNGQRLVFTDWANGGPNNAGPSRNEDCVQIKQNWKVQVEWYIVF